MGKSFRSDDLNQSLLLAPSLHDWLPENHLARFMVDVVETLDLSAIHASYDAGDGRGQSAYAPAMDGARSSLRLHDGDLQLAQAPGQDV